MTTTNINTGVNSLPAVNALKFTPSRYKQDAATLGCYALHMVNRWRETVNRHPESVLFRAKLQTWRDIAGNPSAFINL